MWYIPLTGSWSHSNWLPIKSALIRKEGQEWSGKKESRTNQLKHNGQAQQRGRSKGIQTLILCGRKMPSITHTQTHTKINTYINTHKYAQIHKHKHRRVYINMQKYEHTHTHAFKRGKLNGPWKAHSLFIWLWTNPLGFEQRIITVSPN